MKRLRSSVPTLLAYACALIFFFPVLLLLLTGFKTEAQAYSMPPSLLFTPTLENFARAFEQNYYLYYLSNSIIVVGVSTLLAFALSIPAAFSLAFYPTRRSKDVVFWVLSTRFMPPVGVVVPLYAIFLKINLLDTRTGLIIIYTAFSIPLMVLIMRAYYLDLPREIVEAAQVDGASLWRVFFSIAVPLSGPAIASAGLLSLIFVWNEFFFALMLTDTNAPTLPLFMSQSQTSKGLFWANMSASATMAVLPVVVLGWFAQRYLTRGFTMGAVK